MSGAKPSPWSDEAADFVDAFREDVAVDVDVGVAWAQFEDVVDPGAISRRAPVVWLGVAAAIAAALALFWVVTSATSLHGEASEPGHQAPDGAALESSGVAPWRPAVPARPTARPTPRPADHSEGGSAFAQGEAVVPAPAEVPAARRPAAASRARGRETPSPESAPIASRLAEELRLLDAMRAASKDGRHADALRMVRDHAASFASGSFAAERELARVRALCGLGKHEQVRWTQSRFAKSFPASHLASLVHGACPAAYKENPKSDHDG